MRSASLRCQGGGLACEIRPRSPDGRLASLSRAVGCFARPGDPVLDLGCGTGELAHALSGGMRVVGCDISAQMLWRAAAAVGGRAGWVLLECARVLRPGDVLLCTVPDLRHPVRWAQFFAARLASVTSVPPGRARSCQAYLRASLQRHSHRWWLVTAEHTGLHPGPAAVSAIRSPLRLLVFRRAGTPWSPR